MKKFLFSLQPVLKVKKLKVKEAQRELSEVMREYQLQEGKLNEMKAAEVNSQHEIEKAKNGGMPALIGQYYASLDSLRKSRMQQEKVVIFQIFISFTVPSGFLGKSHALQLMGYGIDGDAEMFCEFGSAFARIVLGYVFAIFVSPAFPWHGNVTFSAFALLQYRKYRVKTYNMC